MIINGGTTHLLSNGTVVDYSHEIKFTEASPRRGCDFCHGIPPSSDGRTQCGWCKDEAF